jgi:hypothetical protein
MMPDRVMKPARVRPLSISKQNDRRDSISHYTRCIYILLVSLGGCINQCGHQRTVYVCYSGNYITYLPTYLTKPTYYLASCTRTHPRAYPSTKVCRYVCVCVPRYICM